MMERLQLLYSNTTPIAFIEGLKESSHSACLCEAEGERFFKSKIIDELGLLNQGWGGDPIVVNRKNKRIVIPSPRCTLSILVQSIVFEKTMRNRGDEFQGIGFNARCLISYPESTQGYRLRKYRLGDLPNIGRFNARSLELFNKQVPLFKSKAHRPERTQLTFSTLAQAEWEHIYEWIERACRAGGIFFRNRDYASKMAENIARMAAVFHAFEGCEGTQISHEHLVSAARIVSWYANEFLRLFSPPSPAEIMMNNARTLDAWLIDYFRETNTFYVPKSYLLTSGPNGLRKADLLDHALQKLIDANRLSYFLGYPGLNLLDPTLQELIDANRPSYFLGHPGLNNSRRKKGTLMLLLHDNYYGQIVRGNAPFNFKLL